MSQTSQLNAKIRVELLNVVHVSGSGEQPKEPPDRARAQQRRWNQQDIGSPKVSERYYQSENVKRQPTSEPVANAGSLPGNPGVVDGNIVIGAAKDHPTPARRERLRSERELILVVVRLRRYDADGAVRVAEDRRRALP